MIVIDSFLSDIKHSSIEIIIKIYLKFVEVQIRICYFILYTRTRFNFFMLNVNFMFWLLPINFQHVTYNGGQTVAADNLVLVLIFKLLKKVEQSGSACGVKQTNLFVLSSESPKFVFWSYNVTQDNVWTPRTRRTA